MGISRVIYLFFLILLNYNSVNAAKLNHPRVLLPIFHDKSVNFTLEVDESNCYKWTSSRQDYISVTPLYEDFSECSNKAIVTVQTRERRRNTAIVFAEDLHSGSTLRCDVIVDAIARLNVRTATRRLYLEEAPAVFELHAFDAEENEFFTLEGIEFSWEVSEPNSNIPPAMRFLTFSDSPYHTVPPALEKFEAKGMKGYMILLEGINTGTSKVTVSMPQPEYRHVPHIEVYISVLANIIIEPSEVTIIPGDSINLRILQLKMDKLHEIKDSKQYYLEVEDTNVAYLSGSTVIGSYLGRTQVFLRDRNVPDQDKDKDSLKGPSALITVAEPLKLGINLMPHNNWVTVVGERHEIALDLYTLAGQKITLGSRYAIKSEVDSSLFNIIKETRNGSRIYGQAINEGISQVYGSYKDLSVQAEMQIFAELKLEPSQVILPNDPNSLKPQKVQFQATGGDYNYAWFSGNAQVLKIDSQGLATTEIRGRLDERGQSHTTVKVTLAKNQNIARLAHVYFLPPHRLVIKEYNFETALQDYVWVHIALYTSVKDLDVPYTKCDNLNFQFDISHPILQLESSEGENMPELAPDACHVVRLKANAVGTTQLRISYTYQDKLLHDSVDIHVYEPLTVLNPLENELVLPVGSSCNVIYANGPQRIFTLEAELTKSINFNSKLIKVIEIEFDTQNEITAFNILCQELGDTEFTYRVYNSLPTANFAAFKAHVTTKVHCVRPRFLKLYARQQLRQSCPLDLASHTATHSLLYLNEQQKNQFEIDIEVQDAKNRKLMNISSLWLEWEFAAGEERYHVNNIPHRQVAEVKHYQSISLSGRDLLLLTMNEVANNFRIKGTVSRYNDKQLAQQGIYAERPPFGVKNVKTGAISTPLIENEIRFHTVNNTLLPQHVSIYMAPSHIHRMPIAQGSGFLQLELSEKGIVQVEHDEQSQQLLLTPIRLGHARLELTDRCLMNEPSHLSISVVGIGAISVMAMDRVERTNSIEAIVKLFDTNDNLLVINHNQLAVYELTQLIVDPTILSVRLDDQRSNKNLGPGELRYLITGNNIGDTKIIFQAGLGERQVSSEALNVQVFAPLRLYPRDSTLVVGSSIQIYYQGGPQPNTNMVYIVDKEKVATMSSAIVTAHRLGATKITGNCLMRNPITNQDEVVSHDTVEVRVVALKAVQIRTPLVRIRRGAVMPATLWGLPDLSPMVLGTLQNMEIVWSVSQPELVEIFNVFTEAGIEYKNSDLISVRIRALNPGKVTITASVRLADGTKLPTASVELIVIKTLELVSPKHTKMDSILAAPRSTLQLKCNMDDAVYKLDGQSSGIVNVTPDGIVHTKDSLGRDLIIAKTVDQTLLIGIEVKNVQYILVTLLPNIKLKKLEHKIPRGMNVALKVSLHDNLGNEFSHYIEDVNGLRYDLATKDVVDAQIGNNLTIALNLQRETNNMIAISLKDTTGVKYAEDYIKLSVSESQHIYPTKTIFSVGDIICFDSPLTLSSIWSSSNEQIVTINKNTGIARILNHRHKPGEKIIITSGDESHPGAYIKYDVEVRESDAIVFLKSLDIFSGMDYNAQLVLRNHIQTDKHTNLVSHNISKCLNQLDNIQPVDVFTCRLTAKDPLGRQLLKLYKVLAGFDSHTSRYVCKLELLAAFNELLGVVKTNDVYFELEAIMPNGILDKMSLKLLPGIKVKPETVQVNDMKPQELHISGLDKALIKLQVKPSDPKYFNVEFIEHGHGLSKYRLRFLGDFPLDEQFFVLVESTETEQHIEIPIVGSTMLIQKCSGSPFGGEFFYRILENIGFVLTTLVITIISIWLYMAFFQTQDVTQVNSEVFQKNNSPNNSMAGDSFNNSRKIYNALFTDSANLSGRQGLQVSDSEDNFVYGNPQLGSPYRTTNVRRSNY